MRAPIVIAFVLLMLIVPSVLSTGPTRPSWPKHFGVYIATSSETIPLFPRAISGYRPAGDNMSYWDERFPSSGSIRIFQANAWEGIPHFPVNMNHCSNGAFMVRWRSANPELKVATILSSDQGDGKPYMVNDRPKTGAFGYIYGFNCEQPMFKAVGARTGDSSNIIDIFYELKFWKAAP